MRNRYYIFFTCLFSFVIYSFPLSAKNVNDKVKCPTCGFLNLSEDRYCLECFSEIRPLSKQEKKSLDQQQKELAEKYYEDALYRYRQAKQEKDTTEAIDLYLDAYNQASSAYSKGKNCLHQSKLKRMSRMMVMCDETIRKLRKRQHAKGKHIKLKKRGSTYYVNVRLNDKVNAELILDTGAGIVLLSPRIVKALGIVGGEDVIAVIADGSRVPSKHIFLQSVDVGGHVATNVPAFYHETNGDGLLGMSFLKHFKFSIDAEHDELVLEEK